MVALKITTKGSSRPTKKDVADPVFGFPTLNKVYHPGHQQSRRSISG